MKTLKTIQEWLGTNPSKDEIKKVLILVNRGVIREMRKEVYLKEAYLRKMVKSMDNLKSLNLEVPEGYEAILKQVKVDIEAMKKSLPEPKKRAIKEDKK